MPYKIEDYTGENSFYLSNLDEEKMQLPVNGKILKTYNLDGI